MGTRYRVTIAGPRGGQPVSELLEGVQNRLAAVDELMSNWKPDSEVSRFNTTKTKDWTPISADLVKVIDAALETSRRGDGAFDITVGPLVRLWNFGPDPQQPRVPTDAEIAVERRRTGYLQLDLDPAGARLRKKIPDLEIDLSAIAKGYAVDCVAEWLTGLGVLGCMVEVGGEVRCHGTKSNGGNWMLGIESPDSTEKGIAERVSIGDRALATSGDYRKFFAVDGKRYAHILDPRTGRPVTHRLASVSVVAETCMLADARATMLFVMGDEEGLRFANDNGWAVCMIAREEAGFQRRATPSFDAYLVTDDS